MKLIFQIIIIFQIIVIINCEPNYTQIGRSLHTAALVGTKIYFFGGLAMINGSEFLSNDFFYLDISESFDRKKDALPFVNLSDISSGIPPHYGAAATVFGDLKDSIFLFGGNMGVNLPSNLEFSFNATQLEWNTVTLSTNVQPNREMVMDAVTDNNNKIYIFGGGFNDASGEYKYSSIMNIFDTVDRSWTISESGLPRRDGHTATFLPETEEIIYIGGINHTINDPTLIDIDPLDVYNTKSNIWNKLKTRNPPEKRYGHTAVLTNDRRIIIFGGTEANIAIPVNRQYVVLDTKTLEWYYGNEDLSTRAPFRHHTATLYNDYMFIAFGVIRSFVLSDDVLIYKIGDYANFTLVNYFYSNNNSTHVVVSSTASAKPISSNESSIGQIIAAAIGTVMGVSIIGSAGFIIYKGIK